jgi:hypothetical protein
MFRKVLLSCALAVSGAVATLTASTLFAQPVGVSVGGGVHVRAPYVTVDVYPGGGVSVRAPFTAVDVGGRPYRHGPGPVVFERPMVTTSSSTSQDLAAMNDEALWRTLRSTSAQLRDRLNNFDTGDTWQRYLRLPDQVIAGPDPNEPGAREAFAQLLQRFRDVSVELRYQKIADLPAFKSTQAALTEVVSRQRNPASLTGATSEELPVPQRRRVRGERSVLNEKTK